MPQSAGIYYCISENDDAGQRAPIVLIHGAGSSHLCWPAELRRLPGHTVYALDLPGHGRSTGTGQQSIAAYAAKVIQFLVGKGIYQAVLVGHSMGGAIALQAAHAYPLQVLALGLISSGACMRVPAELVEHLSNPTMTPVALEWLRAHLFLPTTPEELVLRSMRHLEQARPGVLYGDWQACARFDLRPVAASVSAPAWVVTGALDAITPVTYANFLASQLKTVRAQVIAGAGHMVMLEKPRELEAGLVKFLAEFERAV